MEEHRTNHTSSAYSTLLAQPVYLISFVSFFLLGIPVAFATNMPMLLVFRFLTGFAGSAFLNVAGGTINDMWLPKDTFMPLAIYTGSSFLGPAIGE
jgi:MFS family permease